MSDFKEGDTATNESTGQRAIFQNGQWVPLVQETSIPGGAMGRGFAASAIDNALQIPEAMLRRGIVQPINDALRPVVKAGETAAAFATGDFNQFSQDPRFTSANPFHNNNVIDLPPREQNVIPQITSNDVFAGAQVAGEKAAQIAQNGPGQFNPLNQLIADFTGKDPRFANSNQPPITPFNQARDQQAAITQAAQEQSPMAFATGDIFGDIATITGMRQGTVARRNALRDLARMRADNLARISAERTGSNFQQARSVRNAVDKFLQNSSGLRGARALTGRSVEAGLEGATIAMLDGGDPEQLFGYSAGTQMAGGLMLSGLTSLTRGGIPNASIKLAAAAGGLTAIIQSLKSAAPGGDDFILPSAESAFNKLTAGLALGALAGIAGNGRFPIRAIPEVSDALTSLTRNGVQSVINEVARDSSAELVLNTVTSNPDKFGPKAQRLIFRAIQNPDVSLSDTIDGLMKNREFRSAMESLSE